MSPLPLLRASKTSRGVGLAEEGVAGGTVLGEDRFAEDDEVVPPRVERARADAPNDWPHERIDLAQVPDRRLPIGPLGGCVKPH